MLCHFVKWLELTEIDKNHASNLSCISRILSIIETMPLYDLKLKAELENVESISATDDSLWRVKIECSNCQEVSSSFIEISSKEQVDVPGTRGVCNCLYTCKSYQNPFRLI